MQTNSLGVRKSNMRPNTNLPFLLKVYDFIQHKSLKLVDATRCSENL